MMAQNQQFIIKWIVLLQYSIRQLSMLINMMLSNGVLQVHITKTLLRKRWFFTYERIGKRFSPKFGYLSLLFTIPGSLFILLPFSSLYNCPLRYHVARVHILLHNYILLTPNSIHIFHAYPVTPKSSPLAHHLFFDNMFVKDPTEIKSR